MECAGDGLPRPVGRLVGAREPWKLFVIYHEFEAHQVTRANDPHEGDFSVRGGCGLPIVLCAITHRTEEGAMATMFCARTRPCLRLPVERVCNPLDLRQHLHAGDIDCGPDPWVM